MTSPTPSPMSSSSRRVLIVGAGIAGLATAVRLRRSGWHVQVVERAAALRGGGYMIGFSGIGYQAAQRWGLLPTLRDRQPAPVDLVHVDESGRERARMPVEAQQAMIGEETLALMRGDLESALHEALDEGVELRFATTITDIAQDGGAVTATFSDGTTETADLLVGADGLHSTVRELVFGPETEFRIDFGAGVATCLLDRTPAEVPAGHTVSMTLVGRGVGVYHTVTGGAAGFFSFASSQLDADLSDGPQRTLRRVFGDLGWAVPDLLDQVDASDEVYFDRISQIAMPSWSRGRVVLVGDAAWCVSLFAGYGSSLAVGGADLLGQMLDDRAPDGRGDVSAALASWERHLRPIVAKKQRQGRRARGLFVAPNQTAIRAQALMYRLAGSRLVTAVVRRFLGLETAPKRVGTTAGPSSPGSSHE